MAARLTDPACTRNCLREISLRVKAPFFKEVAVDCQAMLNFGLTEEVRLTRGYGTPETPISQDLKRVKIRCLGGRYSAALLPGTQVVANEKHKLPAVCNTI